MAPATRLTATSNNDDDVNERLRSVEETLATITQTMQEMIVMNKGMNGNGRNQNQHQFTRMTKVDFLKQFIRLNGENVSWNVYKFGILQRFGTVYDDPVSEIRKVKYQTNAKDYQDAFDTLLSRVDISEEHAVSYYLGWLPAGIEMGVRMLRPKTLADAYSLTNLQEATLEAVRKKNKLVMNSSVGRFGSGMGQGSNSKPPLLGLPTPNTNWKSKPNNPVNTPVRKQLTQKEYQEKRAQNLCFYYDQKYTPGHKCSGQLYSLVVLAYEEDEYFKVEEGDEVMPAQEELP
ncbi:hypothetical protein Tco_0928301 [Tanacetum coccineum]